MPSLQYFMRNVQSNIVGQFDWAHWITGTQFHCNVYISSISITTLKQANRFGRLRNQQTVNSESGSVLARYTNFAQTLSVRITSRSFIIGMKKWRPPNRSPRLVDDAISVIANDDVLEANIVCWGAIYAQDDVLNMRPQSWCINQHTPCQLHQKDYV